METDDKKSRTAERGKYRLLLRLNVDVAGKH